MLRKCGESGAGTARRVRHDRSRGKLPDGTHALVVGFRVAAPKRKADRAPQPRALHPVRVSAAKGTVEAHAIARSRLVFRRWGLHEWLPLVALLDADPGSRSTQDPGRRAPVVARGACLCG